MKKKELDGKRIWKGKKVERSKIVDCVCAAATRAVDWLESRKTFKCVKGETEIKCTTHYESWLADDSLAMVKF